jgi:hypothetical protein
MRLSDLGGLLAPYLNTPPGNASRRVDDDFDELSRQAPPEILGDGIAEAFRSKQTPPFGQMLGGLFGRGNPMQRASIINQLIRVAGPAILAQVANGRLRNKLQNRNQNEPIDVTPDEAADIDPADIERAAADAEKQDPSVFNSMGGMLARHPDLVKGLGGAALAIALGQIAQRMNRH